MTTLINTAFIIGSALVGLIGGALVGSIFGFGPIGAGAGAGYGIAFALNAILEDRKPSEC